jgi:hypothetical protein
MGLLFAALREAVEWLKGKAPHAQQTGKTGVDGKSAWWECHWRVTEASGAFSNPP